MNKKILAILAINKALGIDVDVMIKNKPGENGDIARCSICNKKAMFRTETGWMHFGKNNHTPEII